MARLPEGAEQKPVDLTELSDGEGDIKGGGETRHEGHSHIKTEGK